MRSTWIVMVSLGLLLALAACGSGSSDNTLQTGTTGTTTTPGTTPSPVATPTVPREDGTGTGMTDRELAFASEVFLLVNDYRTANGRAALQWSPVVAKVAQDHTIYMQSTGVLTHDGPAPCAAPADCLTPRLEAGGLMAGTDFTAAGENVAYGQQTSAAVMAAWRASATHDQNLLDPAWTHMGVGFRETVDTANPAATVAWWTQVFTAQP